MPRNPPAQPFPALADTTLPQRLALAILRSRGNVRAYTIEHNVRPVVLRLAERLLEQCEHLGIVVTLASKPQPGAASRPDDQHAH